MFFWRYCKVLRTFYFGYFGHAYPCTPKMILSTCRTLQRLSACQKHTSSFTSSLTLLLLKTLHFKESCNLIGLQHFGSQLENQNFAKYGIVDEILILSFYFRLFLKQTKRPYFGAIPGPFFPNLGSYEFSSASFHIFCLSTIMQKIRKNY